MRRYMLAISILSVFYFALAAPAAVREKLEVRSNAVVAFNDGVVLEKRWDSNPRADDDEYESDARSLDKRMDSEYESDARWGSGGEDDGSDSSDSDDDGDKANNNDDDADAAENSEDEPSDGFYDDFKSDNEADNEAAEDDEPSDGFYDDFESDDDGPNDEGGSHESYHGDYKNETPERVMTMADVEELLGPLIMHRPRNYGFGAVGSQKRGVSGNR